MHKKLLTLCFLLVLCQISFGFEFYPCNLFTTVLKNSWSSEERTFIKQYIKNHNRFALDSIIENNHKIFNEFYPKEGNGIMKRAKLELLHSNKPLRTDAECAVIQLPVDHQNINSPKIEIFVKRILANKNKTFAKRALWLVEGGPGGATNLMDNQVNPLLDNLQGQFDIYMYEHRGVGRSQRAGCNGAQSETPGSIMGTYIAPEEIFDCHLSFQKEWIGGQAQHLNSLQAAMDLVQIMKMINVPLGQDIFAYGVSYGTLFLSRMMRFLELTNDSNLVKGVVLDGVCSTKGSYTTAQNMNGITSIDQYDVSIEYVILKLLDLCQVSTTCSKYLGQYLKPNDSPRDFVKETYNRLYQENSCPEFTQTISLSELKRALSIQIFTPTTRSIIPAVFFRLRRCDPKVDIPFLKSLSIFTPVNLFTKFDSYFSTMEMLNIVLSEMWNREMTMDILKHEADSSLFSYGFGLHYQEYLSNSNWTVYNLDERYFNQTFTTTVPILLMNGELDAQTSIISAETQAQNIEGNEKGGLVKFPFAIHDIVGGTFDKNGNNCGLNVLSQFLLMENPNLKEMDTSCVSNLEFSLAGENNMEMYGVENIYNDPLNPPKPIHSIAVNSSHFKQDSIWSTGLIVTTSLTILLSIIVITLLLVIAVLIVKMKRKSNDEEGNSLIYTNPINK